MKEKTKKDKKSFTFPEFMAVYLYEVKRCLDNLDVASVSYAVNMLKKAFEKNKKIFIMGNGGSASTASHMACDLGKGTISDPESNEKRIKIISLSENTALITALGNDMSFKNIFIEQLKNLLEKDDVVIVLSASGNSENIIKAVEYANKNGGKTIGMLGNKTGGKLGKMVDCTIIVDSTQYGPIEDIHLVLNHLITSWIARIKKSDGNREILPFKNKATPFI